MSEEFDDEYGYDDWQPPREEDGRGFDDAYPFEGDEGADRWASEEDDEPAGRKGASGRRDYDGDDEPAEKYDHHELLDQRVTVHCPVADRCGGCEWLAMPYDMQLERKQDYIEELFADYDVEVEPLMCMIDPRGYPWPPAKLKTGATPCAGASSRRAATGSCPASSAWWKTPRRAPSSPRSPASCPSSR